MTRHREYMYKKVVVIARLHSICPFLAMFFNSVFMDAVPTVVLNLLGQSAV